MPAMRKSTALLFFPLLAVSLLLGAAALPGHNLEFTDALVIFKGDGTFQVDLTCDLDALALGEPSSADSARLAARLAGLAEEERAALLEKLRAYFERRVRVRFDGEALRPTVSFPDYQTPIAAAIEPPSVFGLTARLEGPVPAGARSFTVRASRAFPPLHLTVLRQGQAAERRLLEQGVPSPEIALVAEAGSGKAGSVKAGSVGSDRLQIAGQYLVLGFWHIVPEGLDHIFFVLGLFLLSTRLGPLLWQITAFTAAHTLTLALATYGVVGLPPAVVEPLIALSIAYVALENVFTEKLQPWRPWVVFGFGLLHGLGFAGVLGELGLPSQEFLPALLAFNAGVELGQLAVILAALAALGAWRRRPWYRSRVVVPLSLMIAGTGLFWAIQRFFFA